MNHWLVKQEPESYAWETFVTDGCTTWDGVRNYQARNNLRAMKRGDRVLFYASGEPKSVIGVARLKRAAFPDTTATDGGDWVAVEIEPVSALAEPVTLKVIKACPALKNLLLVRHSRLSVMPVSATDFETILKLGGGTRPLRAKKSQD
jgi:predicted RNA-binding protein with PUA-like domain